MRCINLGWTKRDVTDDLDVRRKTCHLVQLPSARVLCQVGEMIQDTSHSLQNKISECKYIRTYIYIFQNLTLNIHSISISNLILPLGICAVVCRAAVRGLKWCQVSAGRYTSRPYPMTLGLVCLYTNGSEVCTNSFQRERCALCAERQSRRSVITWCKVCVSLAPSVSLLLHDTKTEPSFLLLLEFCKNLKIARKNWSYKHWISN